MVLLAGVQFEQSLKDAVERNQDVPSEEVMFRKEVRGLRTAARRASRAAFNVAMRVAIAASFGRCVFIWAMSKVSTSDKTAYELVLIRRFGALIRLKRRTWRCTRCKLRGTRLKPPLPHSGRIRLALGCGGSIAVAFIPLSCTWH